MPAASANSAVIHGAKPANALAAAAMPRVRPPSPSSLSFMVFREMMVPGDSGRLVRLESPPLASSCVSATDVDDFSWCSIISTANQPKSMERR